MSDLVNMLLSGLAEEGVREDYIKMPYSYPGAKGEYLDKILPHLPYGDGYGEAFGGSFVVGANRDASKLEVYNDRYGGITAFFRVVRDPALFPRFMERIAAVVHSREEFIWCKRTWENCTDDVERAARWYYMIRYAVNGKPNSTFGRSVGYKVRFADRLHKSLDMFSALHHRLLPVTIENLDWRQCLKDYDQPGFVWYLDPTYLDSSPGTYQHELSVEDHKDLILRVPHLHGYVAISSYDTPTTRAIYDQPGLWDEVISWDRKTTALTQAFTETNHLEKKETSNDRSMVKELLWLRHWR